MKKIVRSLFSFSKPEVDAAFASATLCCRMPGIKVLASPAAADQPHGKMLIIIPRRAGKAHDRNLLRRQIKAIFYTQKLFVPKMNYIVLVYEQAVGCPFDQLQTFFCRHINVDGSSTDT